MTPIFVPGCPLPPRKDHELSRAGNRRRQARTKSKKINTNILLAPEAAAGQLGDGVTGLGAVPVGVRATTGTGVSTAPIDDAAAPRLQIPPAQRVAPKVEDGIFYRMLPVGSLVTGGGSGSGGSCDSSGHADRADTGPLPQPEGVTGEDELLGDPGHGAAAPLQTVHRVGPSETVLQQIDGSVRSRVVRGFGGDAPEEEGAEEPQPQPPQGVVAPTGNAGFGDGVGPVVGSRRKREDPGYEYCDHTADVQLHAWGRTLEESLEGLVVGMFGYMTDLEKIDEVVGRAEFEVETGRGRNVTPSVGGDDSEPFRVVAQGHDLHSLIFNFLDGWLLRFHTESFVVKRVHVTGLDTKSFTISSIAVGDKFDLSRHTQGTEVKAITYSNMQVKERCRSVDDKGGSIDDIRWDSWVIIDI
mmetsp:Transcript_41862/g.82055  ORF Transcript_41862/g.82055 Transcript_41862/m.82055 type:complete len:413 (-) Transcript_41862:9-1247(-)